MSVLQLCGAILLVLSCAIIVKQARAHACPKHRKSAGYLAWLLAALCAGGGIWLLAAY